jgi:hypothetical protein
MQDRCAVLAEMKAARKEMEYRARMQALAHSQKNEAAQKKLE